MSHPPKSVLMIAFHFPPMSVSSGYLRPFRFAQFLRADHEWQPQVLTVDPAIYPRTDEKHDAWIKQNLSVERTTAIDTQKHLSFHGRYFEFMAVPDQWILWYPFALMRAYKMIRRQRPDIIWSTCPIATTNLVAATLSRIFSIPWVADFRDPMTLQNYPQGKMRWRVTRWVERITVNRARWLCFTAEYTRQQYVQRYDKLEQKSSVIPNGFDELDSMPDAQPATTDLLTLLHAGALFPDGRHPKTLFQALRSLLDENFALADRIRIKLRAAGHMLEYQAIVDSLGLSSQVELLPAASYTDVRKEMLAADGLLLFQGAVYDHAVPAKLYEYLVSMKPILGLITENGEVSAQFAKLGIPYKSEINSVDSVKAMLIRFIKDHQRDELYVVEERVVKMFSRRAQTNHLNDLLSSIIAEDRELSISE